MKSLPESKSSVLQAAVEAASESISRGDVAAAEASLQTAVANWPNDPTVQHLLGTIATLRGDASAAEVHLRGAVKMAPQNARFLGDLGMTLKQLGRSTEALSCFEAAYRLNPASPFHARDAANVLQGSGNAPAALPWMERAVRLGARELDDHVNLAGLYRDLGKSTESLACLNRALGLTPTDLGLRLYRILARLPICYDTDEELRHVRQLYEWGLRDLEWRAEAADPATLAAAANYVGQISAFYLTYQGKDSKDLQRRYGNLVTRFMQARFPQFSQRPAMPCSASGSRIRIGFLSAWLFPRHSNWKMPIKGWVENLNPEQFELYGYYVGPEMPDADKAASQFGDRFRRCNNMTFERVAATIRKDDLHILIYPEVGMWPPATQFAALWLAPIQCSSWGHPETSGLPAVEYFLSSDLMEPTDGDRFYTEKLVRLPKLSVSYRPPETSRVERSRAHFGIAGDAVCYFCAQSLFKYLPSQDYVFAQIAKRVPQTQFIFIAGLSSPEQSLRVKQRIERALAAEGVDPSGKIVMMSQRLSQEEFHALVRACDIFLDTLEWSGCNSAMEAMINGLPVGTCPGQFLRGRHTYGFLSMMGLPDLVAANEHEYIDLMVRLGTDTTFRMKAREDIAARIDRLYDDKECIAGLERFAHDVVAAPFGGEGALKPRVLDTLRSAIRSQLDNRIPKDRPIVLVDFPDSKNCGDLAIWHGETSFLRDIGVAPAFRCSMQEYRREDLARALGDRGVILLHGGGNFGDIYAYHQFREQVLRDFPQHEAILFPHTAKFYSEDSVRKSADFYNARGRIILCARDQRTYDFFRDRFERCESLLVPDMAFALGGQARTSEPVDDVLFLARTDAESKFAKGQSVRRDYAATQEDIALRVEGFPGYALLTTHRAGSLRITDWYDLQLVDSASRQAYVELDHDSKSQLQFAWAKAILSRGRVVVTDRLHAHIMCLLMGIPHVLLDNNYGKLRDFVDTWSSQSPLVRVASDVESALAIAHEWVAQGKAIDPAQDDLKTLIRKVQAEHLTYLTNARLASIAETCKQVEVAGTPGMFVEAGCALGGSAIIIAKCKSPNRDFRLFDVFSMIPPPSAHDGQDVHKRYQEIAAGRATGIGGNTYYGYQHDLLRVVAENLARFDVILPLDSIELVRGLFAETLRISQAVAFAHVDCDWYESVTTCLERIAPMLSPGGVIIVDDYSDWSGCRKAADDFFYGLEDKFNLEQLEHGPLRVTRRFETGPAKDAWRTMPQEAGSWGHRAAEVAHFIPGSSYVLDLGCGTMEVEKFLPADSRYVPCDCVRRDERTLVCDFESDRLPKIDGVTIIVVLGVFEYLVGLEAFMQRLRAYKVPAIVSYVPYDASILPLERRRLLGWESHLTQEQWCDSLRRAGFQVELLKALDRDPTQFLYRLV